MSHAETRVAPLVVNVPLRWGDMDAQGHVNNGGIIDYLQEARVDFLLTGENAHLLGGGVIVVKHEVSYQRPVLFSSRPIEVTVAPVQVGASRFKVGYDLRHDGQVCARAITTLCPFDFDAELPRRLTPDERAWFAERVWSEGPDLPPLRTPVLGEHGVVTDLRVRWSDVDGYGHVNNVRYFDYVQEARIATTTLLDPSTERSSASGSDDGEPRSLWLVARQDLDYVAQMKHRLEPYRVHTAPTSIGTTSVVIAAEIVDPLDGDKVLARGRTVLVRGDERGRPIPLSDRTRELLSASKVE